MNKLFLTLLLLVSFTSGCATIFSDSDYPVNIETDPAGATCTLVGKNYNKKITTPDQLIIPTESAPIRIECETEDAFQRYILDRELDMWVLGNILLGGATGLIIDAVTGSMYELPEHVEIYLENKEE